MRSELEARAVGAGAPWRLRCSKAFRGDACLPLPWPRQWIPQWTGGARKGDAEAPTSPGSGIPKFRPIPLWRLGSPRHLRLCVRRGIALCPLPLPVLVSGYPFLPLLQALSASISVSLCMSVSLFLIILVYVSLSLPL